jgi:hypothetical protein
MCLQVWVGTPRPIATSPRRTDPDPEVGYAYAEEVAAAAAVRARFTAAHVTYVGSHEGCGCGFQSSGLAFDGVATVAEARVLLDAMTADERAELDAEQRSRERLRALIDDARAYGAVELFACWAGDEVDPEIATREVAAPAWLVEQVEPLEERVRYVIAAAPVTTGTG